MLKIFQHVVISEGDIDSWVPVSGQTGNVSAVDLLLNPKQIKLVKSYLQCNSIEYTTTILDLQRNIGKDKDDGDERTMVTFRR